MVLLTLMLYAPALDSGFFKRDDLVAVTVVRTQGPWAGFSGPAGGLAPWLNASYYRPFFPVQVWALHRFFRVNYAGHQLLLIFVLCAAAVTFLKLFLHLGLTPAAGGLLAALFVSHPYISPLVLWISDTAVWLYLLAPLVALLLLRGALRRRHYGLLALLLFVACLLRENGLALLVATPVFAIVAWKRDVLSGRHFRSVLLISGAVLVAYFLLRVSTVGLLPAGLPPEDAGYFTGRLSPAEVAALEPGQRVLLSAYTVGSNLVSTFWPLVRGTGYLNVSSWRILAFSFILFAAVYWFAPRLKAWLVILLLPAAALGILLLAIVPAASLPGLWELAQRALHGALSLLLGLLLFRRREQPAGCVPLVAYAAALIFAGSLIAFAYFRQRNLFLPFSGWLLLLALVLQKRPGVPELRHYRRAALALLVIAVLLNGLLLWSALPPAAYTPDNRARAMQELCNPEVGTAVAGDVAREYGLPLTLLTSCRERNADPAE